MATSSITKTFVIHDNETCDRLIRALEEPIKQEEVKTNYYEEGKKILEQYCICLDG